MSEPTTAYIGFGSNLGARGRSIKSALEMLAETEQIEVIRTSDLIETTPLSGKNQLDYINAVAEIKTSLTAEDVHKRLSDIENLLGRVRGEPWSSRVIDLDLLLFAQQVINHPELTVPHLQMHLRSFVLKGMCQLSAELLHPVMKEPMSALAARLSGADFTLDPDLPQLISIAGIIGVGKTTLTEQLPNLLDDKTLFEAYDTNPFMPDVYAGKKEMALDSEIYFLTSRVEQLNNNTLTKGHIVISDYIFNKGLIYARQLLDEQQLSLYEKIHLPLSKEIAKPVLVIYLTDSVKKCLERIHKRNRPYEQVIEKQFLDQLDCDYKQLFSNWKICPVIRISMSEFDCAKDSDIEHLVSQILCYTVATREV